VSARTGTRLVRRPCCKRLPILVRAQLVALPRRGHRIYTSAVVHVWLRALLLVSLLLAARPAEVQALAHGAPHAVDHAPPIAMPVASERVERNGQVPAAPEQRLPVALPNPRAELGAPSVVAEGPRVARAPPATERAYPSDATAHVRRRRIPRLRDDAAGH
jgi:hypothetical protein